MNLSSSSSSQHAMFKILPHNGGNPANLEMSYFEDSDDSIRDPNYAESSDEEVESDDIETEARPRNTNSGNNEDQIIEETTPKGKKRRRQEANWKINVQKHKVTSGEEHASKTKIIRAKKLVNPCKEGCYLKCSQNINAETRSSIHSMFWNSSNNINHKRQYVASHVKSVLINRKRPRSGRRGDARNHTREYDFEINGKVIRVCKTFFLNTLSISQTFVTTSLRKKKSGGIVLVDDRGRHAHHVRVPDFVRESVREHISQFPIEESHYSREKSKRKYLGSHLNLSKM